MDILIVAAMTAAGTYIIIYKVIGRKLLAKRERKYYKKPSEIRRETKNKQRLRYKYQNIKENS